MKTLLRSCVGIDVSKDSLQVCLSVMDTNQKVTVKSTTRFANQPSGFQALFKWAAKHRPEHLPLGYVMESTGVYHEQLAWYLYQQDQAVSILLPNKAKHYLMSLGHKSKNDQIDALGLARMGLEQQLPLWQPLSKNIYQLRLLTRQHQRLQELKTQSLNQQHALAASQFTDLFIVKQIDNLIALYDKQLADIKDAIEQLLQQDEPLKVKVVRLTAIKGLGLLSIATLVAETNGFTGFDNQRQLVSYAGYDVVENQSGKRVGKTRISKKGNSRIRRILHMPALNAVRFQEPICEALYQRVMERSGIKMKAYVAVQKKLLILAFALWNSDTEYDPNYREKQDKKIVPTSGTTQDEVAEANLSVVGQR
jgi:transposase